jgi:hypothetical protein
MKGQWMGQYNGSDSGSVIVNLDDMGDHYEGVAFLTSANNKLPAAAAVLKTKTKAKKFKLKTSIIFPIDPRTGVVTAWDQIKQFYPNITFSKEAEVSGGWDRKKLTLKWVTDQKISGSAKIPKSMADEQSELKPLIFDWNHYKKHVSRLEERKYLFRGQEKPWRLRTKFHRSGRAELARFLSQDIQTLHKHLSARTKHIFNLLIPDENGAFFNLVQHHGYPTPLLDWTYSPYVAAFFAYWRISNSDAAKATTEQKVRIFVFDQKQWRQDFNQPLLLNAVFPYFSIMEPLAIDNERMIPQQAASSVTNIDDIETYIKTKESAEKKYLYAIDLPLRERKKVINELSCMGITAGSLFPGLDGACEELKERFFEV